MGVRSIDSNTPNIAPATVRVASLNIAHGRCVAAHQLFLRREQILRNMEAIASVLRREGVQIVALQEADRKAFWSGGMNQVAFLSEQCDLRHTLHGEHMLRLQLRYGTALASEFALRDTVSLRFDSGGVLPPKGFVAACITWPNTAIDVDLVSLHLDFARSGRRNRQIDEVLEILEMRNRPVIIMGDFNCEWRNGHAAVCRAVERLNLAAFEPHERRHWTFRRIERRWDWILVSEHFTFRRHEALPDILSDHRLVLAEIELKDQAKGGAP